MDRDKNLAAYMQGSHAVDEAGNPLRLYHGTADDFSEFRHEHPNKKDAGWLGKGFYFSNSPAMANSYAMLKPGKAENVMPVHLSLRNPFYATMEHKTALKNALLDNPYAAEEFRNQLIEAGHDGVILDYGTKDNVKEYVAFHPTQIKSATGNQGTFDPSKSDITKRDGGDVEGKGITVYQGRSKKGAKQFFNPNGHAWGTTLPETAEQFAGKSDSHYPRATPPRTETKYNGEVHKLRFNITNPMHTDIRETLWNPDREAAKISEAKEKGHDGLAIYHSPEKTDYVAFHPDQVEHVESYTPEPIITKADGGKVRFHGTEAEDLQSFDPSKSRTAKYHYLADDPETAKGYGKHVYKVKINPKKMIDFHPEDIGPKHVQVVNELADRLGEDPEHLMNAITSADGSFYGARGSLQDHVMDELKDMGYDAVRFPDAVPGGGWDMSTVILDNDIVGSMTKHQDDITKADGGALDDEGIDALHSSPHDFNQFDISRIGSGEGNQMFGHGLYFSESPSVSGRGGTYWNQFWNKMKSGPERSAATAMWANKFDEQKAIESLLSQHEYHVKHGTPGKYAYGEDIEQGHRELADQYMQAADMLREGKIAGPKTYEVKIYAHPDNLLDWDAPIYQQSEFVQNAVKNAIEYAKENAANGPQSLIGNVVNSKQEATYAHPNKYLEHDGASIQYMLQKVLGSAGASDALAQHGVKGIRYLDGNSRGGRGASRNYVIFNHDHVEIRRKYMRGGAV